MGCLLGTAVGDAIGLPAERLPKRRQRKLFPELDGHRFVLRRGMTSDDTEHTCMLAQALIVSRADPDRFIRSFGWRLRGWLLGLPAGVGSATLRAIVKLWAGVPASRSGVHSAGNGPAMRSALLGVCFGDDPPKLRALVRAASRITHSDPEAEMGALVVAVAAWCSSRGVSSPKQVLATLEAHVGGGSSLVIEKVGLAIASVEAGESTEEFAERLGCEQGITGYIVHTVPAAMHAWLRHPDDYRAGVLEIVRCGGDTDTSAAIVGAIIGGGVGREGIPTDWIDGVIEWPRTVAWMERLGDRLARECHEARSSGPAPRPARAAALAINVPGLLLRNVVFLLIVLTHGFRRLLPPY